MRKEDDLVFHLPFDWKKTFLICDFWDGIIIATETGIATRLLVQHVNTDRGSKCLRKKCRNSAELFATDWKHILHFSSLANIYFISFHFCPVKKGKKQISNIISLYKVSIPRRWDRLMPIATKTVLKSVWDMLFSVLCILESLDCLWLSRDGEMSPGLGIPIKPYI